MARAILIAFVLAAFELCAQGNSQSQTGNLTSYSAGSKEDLSRLAGQMLNATNEARPALNKNSHQVAIDEVNQAQGILNGIEARAPGAKLIPVYQEFVSVSILSPVVTEQNARQASQQAGQNKPAGNKTTGPTVVHQVAGEHTSAVLDTTIVKKALAKADCHMARSFGGFAFLLGVLTRAGKEMAFGVCSSINRRHAIAR